jgi:transcriptional regulator with XRE-family HTH domain
MAAKETNIDYRDKVTTRFLHAMRQIISERKQGCKTITQFAKLIGEHQQNISKMEKGERFPTIDQVCRLCLLFDISPTWILLGEGEMNQVTDVKAALLTLTQRISKMEKTIQSTKGSSKK